MDKFIKQVLEEGQFDGCMYKWLDERYALVFAWDDDGLCGKVAYNCDDLQCDYEWDWAMELTKSEELIDTEICNCEHFTVEQLVTYFKEYYKLIKEALRANGYEGWANHYDECC